MKSYLKLIKATNVIMLLIFFEIWFAKKFLFNYLYLDLLLLAFSLKKYTFKFVREFIIKMK